MQELLRKAFGIYSGDAKVALRFIRMAIFWAFGSAMLETLSDGLFLEKVGAPFLPKVYLSIAALMIFVSTLILYSLKKTSPYRILIAAMGCGVLASFFASFFVGGAVPEWFWYALKIVSKMFFAVMIACSWTFTDQYHDLQDAKRVYSIYSAAYFLGTIFAGLAINLLLDRIGYSGLLKMAGVSILFAMREAWAIAHKNTPIQDDTTEGIFSASRDSASVSRLIFRSRFAIILLLLSLFTQLLITVTEFNYMETFGSHFQASPAASFEGQTAEFLGKCRAIISACNIVIGVFLYSRFVRRMGLNNAILITPLFFLGVYALWIFHNAMPIAVLGLIAVDGVLFTIEDNCFNLLSNAVPTKLKSKVRIINDSFFEPIGMLLSSLLLFGLQAKSHWLGLFLALVAIILAFSIRAIYSKAILINLKDNALHFERKIHDWFSSLTRREQKEAKKDVIKSLYSPSLDTQLLAIKSLLELEDKSAIRDILRVAKSFGTLGKIQLLRLLDQSPYKHHPQVIEAIDSWLNDSESPELFRWVNLYLAKRGLHHPDKAEKDLDHPDLFLRAAAILTMKRSLANPSLDYAALNRTIASKKLDLMLKSSHIDEVALALDILSEEQGPDALERSLPFLSHEAILVKRASARCIAKLSEKRFSRYAPKIIEELGSSRDNLFRLSLLEALGKMSDSTTVKELLLASILFRPSERRKTENVVAQMGLKTVPLLLSMTKDLALPERARILAGRILGRLALPQLQANLIEILDIEIDRAYFYFYFGHTIQSQYPLYDLEMLQSALLSGYQSVIDFIIHLLGAAGSLEDPDLLVRALHSRNEKIHSHAVESLEKTCDYKIFRLILPLIDDLPLEEKMAACLRWHGDRPLLTLFELLSKLERSPSLFDKIVSVRLKVKLEMPNWRQELLEQMKHSDESFQQYAYELLKT